MYVIDFVCHRGITLILIGGSVIEPIGLFDVYLLFLFHSMTKNLSTETKFFEAFNCTSHTLTVEAGETNQSKLTFNCF